MKHQVLMSLLVMQKSDRVRLVLNAEIIQVQSDTDGVETMLAKGTLEKPAKYLQSQENQARFNRGNCHSDYL